MRFSVAPDTGKEIERASLKLITAGRGRSTFPGEFAFWLQSIDIGKPVLSDPATYDGRHMVEYDEIVSDFIAKEIDVDDGIIRIEFEAISGF